MVALVLLILLLGLGAASLLGLTVDTRDTRYGIGPLLWHHSRPTSDVPPGTE